MAAAYLNNAGPVRELLAVVSDELHVDALALVAHNDRRLHDTDIAQPVLVALALGLAAELKQLGELPAVVVGHSLGELSAAAVAGCISAHDAVVLACVRGAVMFDASKKNPGAMLALHTDDRAVVDEAIACGRVQGTLDLAAHNTPQQWVLSGALDALRAVEAPFSTTRMTTGGPWHCSAMVEAEQAFLIALRRLSWSPPRCVWVKNVDGNEVSATDDLPALLAGQLTRPVQWVRTMTTLKTLGVDRFVMVGPAKTLRGICRQNLGSSARIVSASGARAFNWEQVA
jgi:[acyl-carrier-protein] S-malonyltransferase